MCCGSGVVIACGCNCEVICIRHYVYVGGCGGNVHVDVKECGGQNRALGDSVGRNVLCEMTCH